MLPYFGYKSNQQAGFFFSSVAFFQRHRPSLQSVLEILNILNGIIFIQLKGISSSELDEIGVVNNNEGSKDSEKQNDTEAEAESEVLQNDDGCIQTHEMQEEALD